ncbi:MAG: MBL fold metallo-hydrolase [Corallococcus sp.]|nr:MBL fold metallo-hydrolase [Bacillota bacterium]MCM1533146.1 MBL fold metallo-hydrolase [Corallococcus sp.]
MAEKKSSSGKSASGKKKSSGKSSAKTNVNRVVKAAKKYDTSKSFKDNKDAVAGVVAATAESAVKAGNKKQKKFFRVLLVLLIIAIVGIAIFGYFNGWYNTVIYGEDGFIGGAFNSETYDVSVIKEKELSIHFLELGNKYVGDSVYIKAGDCDVLIDAGSRQSSAATISEYIDNYVTDGKLEYVIATHAHQDHIAGFVGTSKAQGIFEKYKCGTIIDFALTNQNVTTAKGANTLYGNYLEKRAQAVNNGAKRYSALDCYNNANGASRTYALSDSVEMEVLYNYYYENTTSDENNYSVCVMLNQTLDSGEVNHYFFSGDLEAEGEAKLVEYYKDELPHCKVYKAGHHGSKTSSSKALMEKLTPEYVCVCTCAGTSEYTKANENQFPTQQFIDNVAEYTDKVFVTTMVDFYCDTGWSSKGTVKSMNGNIVFSCNADGEDMMYFSNNSIKLKDTDWFKEKRICPNAWKD